MPEETELGSETADTTTGGTQDKGSNSDTTANPFEGLDTETVEWLGKNEVKDVAGLAKMASNQASLLGNAIRVPGDDATDEDRSKFLAKLKEINAANGLDISSAPETPQGYEFTVPESLPEDMPYDADRAASFKETAHALKLSPEQASALHDWYVSNMVADHEGFGAQQAAHTEQLAAAEREKLTKRWGPLDGETARANMAFADKAIREVGGDELVASFKKRGILSEDNLVLDETIAVAFANVGMALYGEDVVLHGDPAAIGNPFEEGSEHWSMTKQMQVFKTDPQKAYALIAAAGKKPEDFGLKPQK